MLRTALVCVVVLLAGCASSDASDPATASVAVVGTGARPILYPGPSPRGGGLALYGVGADGAAWKHAGRIDSIGAAWSPRGDWFTEVWGYVNLNLRNLEGEAKIVYTVPRAMPPTMLWERPCWSPDGSKVATVELSRDFKSAWLVVVELDEAALREPGVVEVAARMRHVRHELPYGTAGVNGPYTLPGSALRWSPDGTKVLLAWDQLLVVDAETGACPILHGGRVLAEWAPDGLGVYWIDVGLPPASVPLDAAEAVGARSARGLFHRPLGGGPIATLADAGTFAGVGLTVARAPMHPFGMTLTLAPGGRRLLLTGATTDGTGARLLAYDLDDPRLVDLRRPSLTFTAPGMAILEVDFAPGRDDLLAAATLLQGELAIQTFDLVGGWRRLADTGFDVADLRKDDRSQLAGFDLLTWSR